MLVLDGVSDEADVVIVLDGVSDEADDSAEEDEAKVDVDPAELPVSVAVIVAKAEEISGCNLVEYHGSAVIKELTWLKSIWE